MRFHFIIFCSLLLSCSSKTDGDKNKENQLQNFYPNGNIKSNFGVDSLGRKNGDFSSFYPNGNMEVTGKYENGVVIESIAYYYPNGNIEAYGLFDVKGNLRYRIEFDSLNKKITSEEGKSLYAIIHNKGGVTFMDTLKIEVQTLLVDDEFTDLTFIVDNDTANTRVNKGGRIPLFEYVIKDPKPSQIHIKIMNNISLKEFNNQKISDTLNINIDIIKP